MYVEYQRRCGGLGVVSLPLTRPARVQILARGLPVPAVWSEGRQITLLYCINNTIKILKKVFFFYYCLNYVTKFALRVKMEFQQRVIAVMKHLKKCQIVATVVACAQLCAVSPKLNLCINNMA